MNLSLLPRMAAEGLADRMAIGSRTGGLSYAALLERIESAATWIAGRPVRHVVFLGLNGSAFPLALFASARAGKPFVPLNYRLPDADLQRLLGRTEPALVIVDDDLAGRVAARSGLEIVTRSRFLAIAEAPAVPLDEESEEAVALLLFTSGTTGEPKAAVLRHQHLAAYVVQTVEFAGSDEDEAVLVSVPPYHIAGVSAMLTSLYGGRRIVQLPAFSPEEWITLAATEAITHAMVVPTMLGRILDELQRRGEDLPKLRHLSYGGGRMPVALIERALKLLPHVDFVNAYGLTETSSTIAVLGPEDHRQAIASEHSEARRRLGSVGRPLPSVEVQVRDPDGEPLKPGETGEIWVRGEQVSGEYLDRSRRRADGWLPTSDCGWFDEEGFLYVDGRLDDVIVRGGENLSPGEIEDRLRQHPAVADVAVIGVLDLEWGESVVAVVVARAPVTQAELQAFVREQLRSTKVPAQIYFRDELPFNETGKLLRRALRRELSEPVAIAPGLLEIGTDGVSLLAGRRSSDGRLLFPCPQGSAADGVETVRLGRQGRLWSWTVQRFRPKSPPYSGPEAFTPYAVGYVELPGELIVESRLQVQDLSSLSLGLAMELVVEPLWREPGGRLLATYAFRPVESGRSA